ncbi:MULTISPECIES: hypothetical protein [Saccharothrix]|uniref:hypothetical protein n=1 Tax=Saccharothrix TaxID=2071 RepID=UPI000AB4AE04|nr:hypothetical protein [Saccharothrix sp. CB00851]
MSGTEARSPAAAHEREAIVDGLGGVDPDAFGLLAGFFAEGAGELTARVAEDVRRPVTAGSVVPPPADGAAREADEHWTPAPDLALASAWLDTLGLVLDPLAPLAELGWLAEHVRFLNAPLDWLAGDGDRIKEAVGRWRAAAVDLDRLARAEPHPATAADVRAASRRCAGVAEQLSTAGTITAAVRGMVRDLIGMFAAEVVRNAAVALATAEASGGASLAAFTGWAVGRAAAVLERITGQIKRLLHALARILVRLEALADVSA